MHAERYRRNGAYGPPEAKKAEPLGLPSIEKLKKNVSISKDGCWEWAGSLNHGGYGQWGEVYGVHRIAWSLTNGEIPKGMVVRHDCDNPPCCNPEHLRLGTQADNVKDMRDRGRARGPRSGEHRPELVRKLTWDVVREMRDRHASGGVSQRYLAAEFDVAQATVWAVLRRKIWNE